MKPTSAADRQHSPRQCGLRPPAPHSAPAGQRALDGGQKRLYELLQPSRADPGASGAVSRGKAQGLRRFRCKVCAGRRSVHSRGRCCRGCTTRSAGCPLAPRLAQARQSVSPPRAAGLRRARRIAGATASWRLSSWRRTGLPGSSSGRDLRLQGLSRPPLVPALIRASNSSR